MDANLFVNTIGAVRFGALSDELTEGLGEVLKAAENTQKPATITLVLKVIPSKSGAVEIVDDIKLGLPKEQKGTSIMFMTPEGNLQREDPRQLKIEGLRSVEKQTANDVNALRNVVASTEDPLRNISEHDRREPLRRAS